MKQDPPLDCMTLKFDYSSRDTWETLTFHAAGDHFIDTDGFKVPVRRVMCVEEQAIVTAARTAAHDAYGAALTTAQDSSSAPSTSCSDRPQTGPDSFGFTTNGAVFISRKHAAQHGLSLPGWLDKDGLLFKACAN